jgi:CBS domain-containing protein
VEDEPFERFLLQESKILVEEVMNTKPLCIDHDSSIIEAVSLMLKHNKRYLYVLEDKKLIGILSQKDVLRKILFV